MKNIVSTPHHLGGSYRIDGTRIGIRFLVEDVMLGWKFTDDEIIENYPHLKLADVQGVRQIIPQITTRYGKVDERLIAKAIKC